MDWIVKTGANARVLTMALPDTISTTQEAASYYKDLLFSAGFDALVDRYLLKRVSEQLDYEWSSYTVSEVGFKLSKRRERARENQLMRLRGAVSGQPIQNLHLAEEPAIVEIDVSSKTKVLDFISADVVWQ